MRKEGTHFLFSPGKKKEVDVRGQFALAEDWHCFFGGFVGSGLFAIHTCKCVIDCCNFWQKLLKLIKNQNILTAVF